MHSLPLFHRLAGQPVVVLGEGGMAEPKRRLVERAGGQVVRDLAEGIDLGARLAFIAHEDAAMCEADAIRARCAGLLVNVVDRPELCDFTTPSLLERGPVIVAVGTGGASAGLAKHLRLRLERLLPQNLGALAEGLAAARDRIRARFPDAPERRRALDEALAEGGALDPFLTTSAANIGHWLAGDSRALEWQVVIIRLTSDDPDDLSLHDARMLGMADVVIANPDIPQAILNRARADAVRITEDDERPFAKGLTVWIEHA